MENFIDRQQVKAWQKRHVRCCSSSDEETSSGQNMSRSRQTTLRLFKGIKDLEIPEPEHKPEYVQHQCLIKDRVQDKNVLRKQFGGDGLFQSCKGEQQLMGKQGQSKMVQRILDGAMKLIQSKMMRFLVEFEQVSQSLRRRICGLEKRVNQLPYQVMGMRNNREKRMFEKEYEYHMEINELRGRVALLEGEIQEMNKNSRNNTMKIQPRYFQKSQDVGGVEEESSEKEERSLLEGIDEELGWSSVRLAEMVDPLMVLVTCEPVGDKLAGETSNRAVRDKHTRVRKGSGQMRGSLQIGDYSDGLVQQNRLDTTIIEEEMLTSLSNSLSAGENVQINNKTQSKGHWSSYSKDLLEGNTPKLDKNKRQSLQRQQDPNHIQKHQNSNNIQKQKNPNSIDQMPVTNPFSVQNDIISMIDQQQLQREYMLSSEEKFLLHEIKLLKRTIQKDSSNQHNIQQKKYPKLIYDSTHCSYSPQNRTNKTIRKKYPYPSYSNIQQTVVKSNTRSPQHQLSYLEKELRTAHDREQKLVSLLKTMKGEIQAMRNDLANLVPCQYCGLRQIVENVLGIED